MPEIRKRIALVTHVLDGGVWSMTRYLYSILQASRQYEPALIVLATSRSDEASVRILDPRSWLRPPQIITKQYQGYVYKHAGAWLSEVEIQRYQPRRGLTQLLRQYDLVQIVSGSPAYAFAARAIHVPLCIFAATTARQDRLTYILKSRGLRKQWIHLMTAMTDRVERAVLRQADHIFALSSYTLEQFKPYALLRKLSLAPAGIDVTHFYPNEVYCSQGPILCVARLDDPRKNAALLLEAYSFFRQTQPQAPPLVLVSTADLTRHDQILISERKLGEYVKVYVSISRDEIRQLYREASCFVLSSNEEGLGIVILEAMASGLPVISTDCGGPATMVLPGETGWLTPVGDAVSLANAMAQLWAQPEVRRKMGQAGRQRAIDTFSLQATGRVFLNVYAELLQN